MAGETNKSPEAVGMKQFWLEVFFMLTALAAVRGFVQNTPVMSALIGINLAARFIFIRRKHDWIFFMIGFVAGGGNDLISMIKNVYYYTPKDVIPIPIWMLVFWGHIFVAFRQMFQLKPFQAEEGKWPPLKLDARIAFDLATLIALRIVIYKFVRHEPTPAIAYASIIAARLLLMRPAKHELLLMMVVTPMGIAYEAALIKCGLYVYYDPIFMGMPAWLMIYWVFMLPVLVKGLFDRIEFSLAQKM